jgi:CheY-like chemotaxis protein/two-component sensor histidine kinase
MLAHELRNPLAPLRSSAEILQTDEVGEEMRAQAREIIRRQIENMSRILDDLLDVSRITEGKISLHKSPISMQAVLTAAADVARSQFAFHNQEFRLTMPSEPIWLDADATRLEQIFGNLLNNACKYAGVGCRIGLSAQRETGVGRPEVVIRVSDDGAGIEPELLPRIFDLFVQASRSADRKNGGLGIGLTLVRRLVKLHGGSIEARSEGLGRGAEFLVRLPILSEAPAQPAPVPPAPREASRRILIVDDNTDSAHSMALLQSRHGHQTHTAFTGPDAVIAAAEYRPEFILLDIGLPGMDGFEVARTIRSMPELAGVILIAMSGYGSKEHRAQARQAGFDAYMVKPIDLDRLQEMLSERR